MIIFAWIVALLTFIAGISVIQMKAMPPALRLILAAGYWLFTVLYTLFQLQDIDEPVRATAVRTGLVLMSVGTIWMRMVDFRSYAPLLAQNERFAEEIEKLKREIEYYKAERLMMLERLTAIERKMAQIYK
jgi:hypothetical protein